MFKIFGDVTPKGGKSLCTTCQSGQIIQGQNFEQVIRCSFNWNQPLVLDFIVEKCSGYYRRGTTSYQDMEKIAWIISTETVGPIGFANGSEERVITVKKPEPPTTVIERVTRQG